MASTQLPVVKLVYSPSSTASGTDLKGMLVESRDLGNSVICVFLISPHEHCDTRAPERFVGDSAQLQPIPEYYAALPIPSFSIATSQVLTACCQTPSHPSPSSQEHA